MEFRNNQCFIIVILLLNLVYASCRTTVEQDTDKTDKTSAAETIRLHVITKREAMNDLEQVYPHVNGRTFRASAPLDPNSPASEEQNVPQNLLDGFETVSEIFQPQVHEEQSESGNNGGNNVTNENSGGQTEERSATGNSAVSGVDSVTIPEVEESQPEVERQERRDDVQNDVSTEQQPSRTGYQQGSRQTGYAHDATQTGNTQGSYYPTDSRSNTRTQGNGYYDTQETSRRVVLAGRGPDTDSSYSRTSSYGNLPRQTSYPSRTADTRGPAQTTEVRGPYYGGPRYVDNNGHYVDAQGRHLDSTGRYYDVSGRYQDATMTRTVIQGSGVGGSNPVYTHNTRRTGYDTNPNPQTGYDTIRRTVIQGSGGGSNPVYNTDTRTGYDNSRGSGYYGNTGGYVTSGGSRGGHLDSSGRYVESGNIGQSGGRPINSYGGNQFYSGGNTYQTTYNPVTSQISSDTTCTNTNDRITVYINDLECHQAISQIGRYVCYNYERVSTACCQGCLQVKEPQNEGCEYGDRSAQCEAIRPSDCYTERNRQVCCNRCRHFREQMQHLTLPETCSYGDRTPQCQNIAQRNHLCYLPENQRVCCATCPRYANQDQPNCQWGNQSPEFCEPFDGNGRVRLNCYRHEVRDICCSTCRSLRDRMPETISGCEYGDYPILFYVGNSQLTCMEYIRQFGVESCDDPSLARQCCYTCYRYRNIRG